MSSSIVDVDRLPAPAVALADEHGPIAAAPHAHEKHQLLFAARGTMQLVACGRRWLLPPRRAAFVDAGVVHEVASVTGISLRTVYFAREFVERAGPPTCAVFEVPPLGQEMLTHAARWDPRRAPAASDRVREPFLRALVELSLEWMATPARCHLPEPSSAGLARAAAFVRDNLATATPEAAAKAGGMSARTLTRRFEAELGQSFRDYRAAARTLRAMEILASRDGSVTRAALEVGFAGLPAFSTAFKELTGETPSDYRARALSGG